MTVLIGLDPGGIDAFGWCVCEFTEKFPLHVIEQGIESCAHDAVAAAVECASDSQVIAAGIDSPLCWAGRGDRLADQQLRSAVAAAGCRTPWGTVQIVNALRGACLVQGILALRVLRRRFPRIIVSEAHPKALLWLLGAANANLRVPEVGPQHLSSLVFNRLPNEHERDAALGTLSAWAALVQPAGWSDLLQLETDAFFPAGEAVYYMPLPLPKTRPPGPTRPAV